MNTTPSSDLHRGVLRFITAGSVDDGKSTLIGRLLYDSKAILQDQLDTLSNAKHTRVKAKDAQIDLALLTDGLEAEREQGITIDVAYRYFATLKRKFIVADAPGHEQYTRNMVTGASQADVAVILIDATRVGIHEGVANLLDQTKRHSAIVKLLGLKHIIVAINKMDLVDYDERFFNAIVSGVQYLAKKINLPLPIFIPVSALLGDNIVDKSKNMAWYKGDSLLSVLENVNLSADINIHDLRLPVQMVVRQDGGSSNDFRGYMGRIEAGSIRVGQTVQILPTHTLATVADIIVSASPHSPSDSADLGQCVTIRLTEDVDISRGDMIVAKESQHPPTITKNLQADICWLDQDALSTSRKYILRHTTHSTLAKIKAIHKVLDVKTLSHTTDLHALLAGEIGTVSLSLQKPIVADLYDELPSTGGFILVDETTHHTVAAGMIRAFE